MISNSCTWADNGCKGTVVTCIPCILGHAYSPFKLNFVQVSWAIAEFWNTVSNLFMIIPALYGVYQARKQGLEHR